MHSQGVQLGYKPASSVHAKFQFMHSHGVQQQREKPLNSTISIHALTGSATYWRWYYRHQYNISIHALTGSATTEKLSDLKFQFMHSRRVQPTSLRVKTPSQVNFNSCTHAECNRHWCRIGTVARSISIHALTGSATMLVVALIEQRLFQFMHSHGVQRYFHLLI